MTSFIDERLPEDIERGATGGPRFKTSVTTLSSGFEKRNVEWSKVRGRWDIAYGLTSLDQVADVINMFYAAQGRARGFRFKDWSDFQIGKQADDSTRQSIGTGDGAKTEFDVFKRYGIANVSYDRRIYKLVSGTTKVFLDGVEPPFGFSVDVNLGRITFNSAPAEGVDVSVITEFDVPVRFDTDELPIETELFFQDQPIGQIPRIDLVELRVEDD